MAIMRRRTDPMALEPWRELDDMQARFRRMFGDVFGTPRTESLGAWVPAVEITETDDELLLSAELPGMNRDDVEIELENNVLTLRGEKRDEREEKGKRYHLWERSFGSFERSFPLPRTVDAEKIRAEFRNGVLTVHLPKVPEARGRRIEIVEA